jgi:hypothetical protein
MVFGKSPKGNARTRRSEVPVRNVIFCFVTSAGLPTE